MEEECGSTRQLANQAGAFGPRRALTSASMKTLHLHIGTPKTGTTSLQNFLVDNAAAFAKSSIYVKQGPQINNEDFSLLIAQRNDLKIQKYLDDFIAHRTSGTFVISCELLYMIPLCYEFLGAHGSGEVYELESYKLQKADYIQYLSSQLVGKFDHINIVIYFRRQDEFINSNYIQDVQFSLCVELDDYMRLMEFECDYESNAGLWADRFGEDAITIVPYEKQSMRNGIEGTFCELLQQDYESTIKPVREYNPSITPAIFEFKRRFNRAIADIEFDPCGILFKFYAYTDNMLKAGRADHGKLRILSYNDSLALLEKYSSGNALVATRFLDRAHLFHDREPDVYEVSDLEIDPDLLFDFLSSYLFQIQLDIIHQSRDMAKQLKKVTKLVSTPVNGTAMADTDAAGIEALTTAVESLTETIRLLSLSNTTHAVNEGGFAASRPPGRVTQAAYKLSLLILGRKWTKKLRQTISGI